MKLHTPKDLYVRQLRDLYSAEKQLVAALPKMAKAARSQDLKAAFETHLLETKEHVRRLEECLRIAGAGVRGPKCKGMEGLVAEGSEMATKEADPRIKDLGLIAAAQRVEHYEIAGYGSVCSLAKLLGDEDGGALLKATMSEEKTTDKKLSELALAGGESMSPEKPVTAQVPPVTRAETGPKNAHTEYQGIEGRRVLVTGGTTGLGRAIALRLSSEGARVMIFGRHQQELDDALSDIRNNDPEAIGTLADASNNEDLERVFSLVDEEFGGLDVLVNNAGLSADALKDTPDEERETALKTNINGYLTCAKLAMERMEEHSHIILIGSIDADDREPGGSIYVATKGAVQAFAESFRQEAAEDGILVSLIEPGKTGSEMVEESPEEERDSQEKLEMLKAEDIAVCVEYILTQPRRCNVSQVTIVPARNSAA